MPSIGRLEIAETGQTRLYGNAICWKVGRALGVYCAAAPKR